MAEARVAILFAGVPVVPTPRLRARIAAALNQAQPLVLAADGGAASALAFGLRPDLVVGDLDSLDPLLAADLRGQGVAFEAYPTDKDATDGELVLERALTLGAERLLLLGFLGGARFDHGFANVLLLSKLPVPATLLEEANECTLLRGGETRTWAAEPGEIVSLVPLAGDACGITTTALRWPLRDATLRLGESRGVSNEPVAPTVGVTLRRGLLLVTRHFPRPYAPASRF